MKPTCARLLVLLSLLVLTGCGGDNEPTRSIDFIPLSSIEITSRNPQAAAGTTNQFTAIGHYGDPSTYQFTLDITSQVSWTSSAPAVLSFSTTAAGFATMGGAGPATVTATFNAISSDLPFTVTNATIASLVIAPPPETTLFAGQTLRLRITGTFTDESQQDLTEAVTWSSSDPTVATVSATAPGAGLVTALTPGTTDISGAFDNLSATQTLVVATANLAGIAVTSTGGSSTLALGTSMQLLAIGTYTDAGKQDLTSQVTWTSSNTAVATVDQVAGTTGKLSSVGSGSTTVTASLTSITSSGLKVTVSSATLTSLAVSPTNPTILVGNTVALSATGDFSDGSSQEVTRDVAWSSADTAIATVSLTTGVEGSVKGIATGAVTISASSGDIPSATGAAIVAGAEVTVQ